MLARFVLWLIRLFPILSYDYRHRRIRRRQICPNCGNYGRVHIRFDPSGALAVCQCQTCMACWGYNSVVKPEIWATLPKVEE